MHRLTQMLKATGLRLPRRVVGGGGIFLEYDGRNVPDTATITVDYNEGAQIVVSATMCCDHPIEQCIRGHHGTIVFDMSSDGFKVIPERPQVTRISGRKQESVSAFRPKDETYAHWENFLEAVAKDDQQHCNNPPDLGAAAIVTITMGAESYRYGKVFELDGTKVVESGPDFAKMWENLSDERAAPRHVAGWNPENKDPTFSRQKPQEYQKLEGPWINGKDPSA